MSDTPTPETDALISVGLENADRECVPAEFAQKMERERDEARAVAGELADIASKHLSFLLAATPIKANETHEKDTMRVIAALKRWKKL